MINTPKLIFPLQLVLIKLEDNFNRELLLAVHIWALVRTSVSQKWENMSAETMLYKTSCHSVSCSRSYGYQFVIYLHFFCKKNSFYFLFVMLIKKPILSMYRTTAIIYSAPCLFIIFACINNIQLFYYRSTLFINNLSLLITTGNKNKLITE